MRISDGAFVLPVVLAGAVLLWSGLEKVRNRGPLTGTLSALGIASNVAMVAAIAVPLIELAAVVAVVAGAPPYVSGGLFAALGTGFAVSAAWSMITGRTVACSCLGSGTSGKRLGWRQVAALPPWLYAGWAMTRLPESTGQERLAILACVAFALAALRATPTVRQAVAARNTRRALAGG